MKINYSTCDIEELDFDRGVHMPNWVPLLSASPKPEALRRAPKAPLDCFLLQAAELAPSGPGEAGRRPVARSMDTGSSDILPR